MRTNMAMTFNELCKQLNLHQQYISPNQLETLEQWCLENISQDRKFYGTSENRYDAYLNLARDYLDDFLPFVSKNSMSPMAQFDHMNVIQYAASQGFNHFLSQLDQTLAPELWNSQTDSGMTALHLAAVGGYFNSVNTLLDRGAEPTIANHKGKFPLQSSLFMPIGAEENEEQLKTAKMQTFKLLQDKAPFLLNAVDASGETVAHQMAAQGFPALIKDLVQAKNALVTQPNHFKKYPIHVAILNGQLQCAQELLAFAGTAALIDAESRTPLHYAAKYAHTDFIEACCKAGAEVDARDQYAMTPLLKAAEAGNLPSVQLLIKKGANPLLTDYNGLSILHFAAKSKNPELVAWILAHVEISVNIQDHASHTPLDHIQNDSVTDTHAEQIINILVTKGAHNSSGNSNRSR